MAFLMASKAIGTDPALIDREWSKIERFLHSHLTPGDPVLIGNIHTGALREKLEKEGWDITVLKQGPAALLNYNRKLIRDNSPVLFIRVDLSSLISNFIDYAKNTVKVPYHVLDITK